MSKIKNLLLIQLFLLALILSACSSQSTFDNKSMSNNLESNDVTIEGVITDVNNGCWMDGICSIEVNHKWNIAIISGGLKSPNSEREIVGEVAGIEFAEGDPSIGKRIEIFAKQIDEDELSIFGSEEYYVKVIK